MKKDDIKVSVIIPTMASHQRALLLKRSIESIRHSSRFPISIIVVVNGNQYDEDLCEWLKSQSDIDFQYLETPSSPQAILRGRELIKSEFFSMLDDDDEYLEGSTDEKLKQMESNSHTDVVVTNGYRNSNGIDSILFPNFPSVFTHPLRCLMDFGWLNSCNALYRTATVDSEYFRDSHPYAEWTWLAFKLTMDEKRIDVLDKPTFRYNDTFGSISKSENYCKAYLPLFERMLASMPPPSIATLIRRNRGAAWHDASNAALRAGNRIEALKYHWRSLMAPSGGKYLGYSRHFFFY